jgi:hypothetical protein
MFSDVSHVPDGDKIGMGGINGSLSFQLGVRVRVCVGGGGGGGVWSMCWDEGAGRMEGDVASGECSIIRTVDLVGQWRY